MTQRVRWFCFSLIRSPTVCLFLPFTFDSPLYKIAERICTWNNKCHGYREVTGAGGWSTDIFREAWRQINSFQSQFPRAWLWHRVNVNELLSESGSRRISPAIWLNTMSNRQVKLQAMSTENLDFLYSCVWHWYAEKFVEIFIFYFYANEYSEIEV